MRHLITTLRGVKLYILYEYSKAFEEVIVKSVTLQDSEEDIYDLLGQSDVEDLNIKCMEDYYSEAD